MKSLKNTKKKKKISIIILLENIKNYEEPKK